MNAERASWHDLPGALRALIEARTGPVARVQVPDAGRHSDFAASLFSSDRVPLAFVKGSRRARTSLARELLVGPHLRGVQAPALLWLVEADGWSAAGFEHIDGRHAEFTDPTDLRALAGAVRTSVAAPDDLPAITASWRPAWPAIIREQVPLPPGLHATQRLVRMETDAFNAVRGNTLVHTDINPYNVLMGQTAWLVDWAWAASAAPWVDAALTVPRLLTAGHSIDVAEEWAATIPAYIKATDLELAQFAVANLGRMIWLRHLGRSVHTVHVRTAREWADHRLARAGEPPLSVHAHATDCRFVDPT